jgi:general secretion pathway protein C
VLHVLFIGAFAFVGAQTTNLFVAQSIRPAIKAGVSSAPGSHGATARTDLTAEAFAKMMGMTLPEPVIEETSASGPGGAEKALEDPNAAAVRTSLRLQLIATVMANRPEWSIATIRDLTQNTDDVYMVGDIILGARITDIQQLEAPADPAATTAVAGPEMRVMILNEGHREYIDLSAPGTAAPKPVAVNTDAPASTLNGEGIKKLDDHHFQIERSTVNSALTNMNDLAMQARIVPSFKNGQADGFKLFSIRPDSLYSKIGIVNGDVIQRINGLDINSPDKALEAYGKLKSANALDLTVERNGTPQNFHYAIQ